MFPKSIKIIAILLISMICVEAHAENRSVVTFKEYVHQGASDVPKRALPKKVHRKSNNRCNIIITYDETIPDSVRRAFSAAELIWESLLPAPQPIFINVSYESLDSGLAMLADVIHMLSSGDESSDWMEGCPNSLAAQIAGEPLGDPDSPHGIIVLNRDLQWNCSFADNNLAGYNVTTSALRGIALCLGFGSSIYEDSHDNFRYAFAKPTYFDKLLHANGAFLSDLTEESSEMKNFITSQAVSLTTKDETYSVYSPQEYQPYTSLVHLNESNSLMSYNIGEGSIYQTVDEATLDILRTLGWNIPISGRKIMCDDIADDGIGSAYSSHSFSLAKGVETISSIEWRFSLKDNSDNYVEVKRESTSTFTIDKISATDNYYITSDGDLEGIIECTYFINGKKYSAVPFCVSLELKPLILSIENIQKIKSGYEFYLTFTVNYYGADYVTVRLEEEDTSFMRSKFYYEPFMAHVTTENLSSFVYSWVTIIAANKYGTDTKVLECEPFSAVIIDKDRYFRQIDATDLETQVYNLQQEVVFKGKEMELRSQNLPHGLYIKHVIDQEGNITKEKVIL